MREEKSGRQLCSPVGQKRSNCANDAKMTASCRGRLGEGPTECITIMAA